ncbi:MAG TPA: extensin family protein [Xanthobacteraceae bacterium]|nr:extensin family protein [Xanthobacteraceae bacterium]
MKGRLPFSLVAAMTLGALAGCGRGFFQFEERAPWRHEAEVECLQSGAVKEGAGVVRISPIEGPGMCGADFPLKVSALGESTALGFADDPRPPGSIPNAAPPPRWPVTPSYPPVSHAYPPAPIYTEAPAYPPPLSNPNYAMPPDSVPPYDNAPPLHDPLPSYGAPSGEPLSLAPPGLPPASGAAPLQPSYAPSPSYRPDRAAYPANSAAPSYRQNPSLAAPPAPPRLGPQRDPRFAGAIPPVEVTPAATLACPIVSVLDQWIKESVQPAAMRWFGQPVVEIKQISAYSCRTMNGRPGANISEHAFGNALDIAGFTLADGRKIVVRTAWRGTPEEQGFLHDVQGSACQDFTTVLAPGSNSFHYDHIHVDLMRRASRRLICEPAAIPGEVAAARASHQYARRDPAITGSIANRQQHAGILAIGEDAAEEDRDDAFDN